MEIINIQIYEFLHVGCGPKSKGHTTRGFNQGNWVECRLDVDPSVNPDVVGSMTNMEMLKSGRFDAVFSSHNIEHLYPHEVPAALSEFYRVLNEEGFVVITCPDLKSVCERVANDQLTEPAYVSPAGPISPIDILFGLRSAMQRGNTYMAHRCGFTQKVLSATLLQNGFKTVATKARPQYFDLWALASKSEKSQEEMHELVKYHFPD